MLVLGAALSLNGCYSDQELANASRIITALPEEIMGCVFLGDVDTSGALAMMDQARRHASGGNLRIPGSFDQIHFGGGPFRKSL